MRKHQLLVVLGFRPSISSIIRSAVFNTEINHTSTDTKSSTSPVLSQARQLSTLPSSPCYLTLCDGEQGVVIEKDLFYGRIKSADQFIVQTNHDSDHSSCCEEPEEAKDRLAAPHNELWLQDSTDRMGVIQRKWVEHSTQVAGESEPDLSQANKNGNCISRKLVDHAEDIDVRALSEEALREWMKDEHISNNFTHFACILDPVTGRIRWLARGPTPQATAAKEASD